MPLPLKLGFAEIRKLGGDAARDLHYWYCPEGADGEPVLLLHKKKVAVSDINEARKGAKSTKSSKGRIGLDDKTLKMRVVGAAPSNMAKQVRKIAADHGLRVPEVVLVENQPDVEDEDDSTSESSSSSASADGDRAAAASALDWDAALLKAKPHIDAVRAHEKKRVLLPDLMQDANDKAARGRFAEAIGVLDKVAALAKLSDAGLATRDKRAAVRTKASAEQIEDWQDDDAKWKAKVDLGRYDAGAQIGAGGMGAIKLLTPRDAAAPPLVLKTGAGLDHEAEMYDKIGAHPNIVKSLGMQTVNGQRGLVLEAVSGGDMSKALGDMNTMRAAGKLSEEEYWGMMQFSLKRSLEALAFMQQQGLVHRDMKPPNVMFDDVTGEPKLVDMGVGAEIGGAQTGQTMGYAPMHQTETDPKRDTFAVGASAWEAGRGNTGADGAGAERFKFGDGPQPPGAFGGIMKALAWHADDQNRALKVSDDATEVFDKDADGNAVKKKGAYGANSAYVEFVNLMMHPDPAKRPTPAEALNHPFFQQSMLDDDAARATVKKVIASRKAPAAPAVDPLVAAKTARNTLAAVIRGDLPKQIDAAAKRAEQAGKLATALLARAEKDGAKGRVMAEELPRYEALVGELTRTADPLRDARTRWSDAARALTDADAALPAGNAAAAKQAAGDQKLLQGVSATLRRAQDALDAMEAAIGALNRALGKADDKADDQWTATDLALTSKAWGTMKKQAIQHGLKDEATGMTPAMTTFEKLLGEYNKKKAAKVHAGVLLAIDKLRGKVAALAPVTTWGGPHPGMVDYRAKLLTAIDAEKTRLQADGPGGG